MEIKRDWKIEIDKEQLLKAQGKALDRLLARPGMQEQFDRLIEMGVLERV